MNDVTTLAATIAKANEAAEKLLKCAESISNPVYSVTLQGGGKCEILAVRHFAGNIEITVALPGSVDPRQRQALSAAQAWLEENPDSKRKLIEGN